MYHHLYKYILPRKPRKVFGNSIYTNINISPAMVAMKMILKAITLQRIELVFNKLQQR